MTHVPRSLSERLFGRKIRSASELRRRLRLPGALPGALRTIRVFSNACWGGLEATMKPSKDPRLDEACEQAVANDREKGFCSGPLTREQIS